MSSERGSARPCWMMAYDIGRELRLSDFTALCNDVQNFFSWKNRDHSRCIARVHVNPPKRFGAMLDMLKKLGLQNLWLEVPDAIKDPNAQYATLCFEVPQGVVALKKKSPMRMEVVRCARGDDEEAVDNEECVSSEVLFIFF